MRRVLFTTLLLMRLICGHAQSEEEIFQEAFNKINCMLDERCEASFKEAVFAVENAYLLGQLNKEVFDGQIRFLTELVQQVISSRELLYDMPDKDEVMKCAAIFTVMTDTISIELKDGKQGFILPYSYDFLDIWGHGNWSNMFVSKLLDTKKGNCHSLPYLYKIIAEQIGTSAHISVAPNHFYIKHQNKANGWYNTELTSGIFPMDAWLMASGYIHLDAIVNKLYMEALSEKQMLALCMVDLAKAYERRLGIWAKPKFVLQCTEAALAHYPHYINALILKAETKKKLFEALMGEHKVNYAAEIFHLPEAKALFEEMTNLYTEIHHLGYRKMPEAMYLDWLVSLKNERNKYENKKISNFNTKAE